MKFFVELGSFLVENKGAEVALFGNWMVYIALLTPRWKWWTYPMASMFFLLFTPQLFSVMSAISHASILTIMGYSLMILPLICFANSFWQTLTLCFMLSIINRLCTFFGYAFYAGFGGNDSLRSTFVILSVVYFILSFVCWIWVRKYIERLNQLTLHGYLWPMLATMSLVTRFLVDFCSDNVFNLNPTSDQTIIWSMIALCVFALSMLALLLYNAISSAILTTEKNISDHLSYELDVQKRYYESQLQSQDEVRRMKHDMRGHLITAIGLLQSGKPEEAQQYLGKVSDITSKSVNHTYAADPYIDAVISCFATLFKRNNVKFSCSIHVIPIEKYQVELCLVFSNALQNALEASLNLPPEKRSVSVTAKIKFDYLVLQVANRYAGLLELADGALPPTIKDSTGHGYGLSSIKTTLESMGGVLNLRTDKDIFLLEATAKIH